jgi:AcrR family transcriptional regulator
MVELHERSGPTGTARSSGSLYRKLSPGPGRSAAEVAAHQRERIHGAMLEIATEQGYGAVTVRALTQLAGVSTHTFYEHFDGKEECFLSTCELVVRRAARRVFAAQERGHQWDEQVRLTFRAVTRELACESKGARLALVDAFEVGPAGIERVRRAGALLEAMAAQGFASAPDGVVVPPLIVKGIVAGLARVACARLLAGRESELLALTPELMDWALCFRSESASALGPPDPQAPLSGTGVADNGEAGVAGRQALEDERALILTATTRLAADEGYRQLSVPGIRTAAGVSRKSVDTHFEDVTDCFLAALELLIRRAVAYAVRQGATADSWPAGLHRALVAFCTYIARDPAFARLGFVEVFAPGTPGVEFRRRLIGAVADRLRRSAPARKRPSELAAEASVGAALGILHHYVVTGRAAWLPRAAPTLSFMMLAPAIGAPAAAAAIRAEREWTPA